MPRSPSIAPADRAVAGGHAAERPAHPALEALTRQLLAQQPAFRAFLRKRLSDDMLVDDLLQQSLMKAVERSHELKKSESAVRWFYRVLRNAVVDSYRSQAADSRKAEGLLHAMVASGEDRIPTLDEVRPTLCACLGTLLKDLRPSYAELIQRIDLEGQSLAAVARDLRVTPNNLTVRLHRARQALKASLERVCGICTKHGCLNCTCA